MRVSKRWFSSTAVSGAAHKGALAVAGLIFAAFPFASAAEAAGYNVTNVFDPTGTNFINLLGINNSGTIAGFDNAAVNQGFTLTLPSSFTTVTFPGAPSTMV